MGYLLSPMVPFELLEAIQGVNIIIVILSKVSLLCTRMTLSFQTYRSWQTVQTQRSSLISVSLFAIPFAPF